MTNYRDWLGDVWHRYSPCVATSSPRTSLDVMASRLASNSASVVSGIFFAALAWRDKKPPLLFDPPALLFDDPLAAELAF